MSAAGFVDPWSVRAGSRVVLHLSSSDRNPAVSVVRLDQEPISATNWNLRAVTHSVEPGNLEQGSWLELPWNDAAHSSDFWSLSVEFSLTRNVGTRPLVAGAGFRLDLNDRRHVVLRNGDAAKTSVATLEEGCWYVLELHRTVAPTIELTIGRFGVEESLVQLSLPMAKDASGVSLALGASLDWPLDSSSDSPSDSRLDSPLNSSLDSSLDSSLESPLNRQGPTLNARIGRVVLRTDDRSAHWSFAPDGNQLQLRPVAGEWPPIRVHNSPTFAVKSARWDGSVLDPRANGSHYDALHLHDDDMGSCNWDASHELDVPPAAPSGVYAFEVVTTVGVERIPFFVRPRRPSARLLFLVPTATYVAYGDEFLPAATYPWQCWDRGHQFAQDNNLRSLYDIHSDQSGVTLSTWRRPKATLRDDYAYPLSNSPHLLPVDLHLLRFCHRHGIEIDILTDHDLHTEGYAAIAPYAGIFTGSHPEYWSSPMMLALDRYLDGGGNLAYLGGNGFYLAAALEGDRMELRRDPNDSIWSSPVGERYMALDGEPGGYWESRGRPPQSLVGCTYLMMGFGPSRPYKRLEASYADDWAWIFDKVDDQPIGDSGMVLGGAAGYEVDGVIEQLHAPPSLVRLATAGDFEPSFQVREQLPFATDAAERAQLRRADMTIYRHRGGGLVFSVGSVAWCGALPCANDPNAVGSITLNIAKRFSGV
jgi:N,N-dimethylformamidase